MTELIKYGFDNDLSVIKSIKILVPQPWFKPGFFNRLLNACRIERMGSAGYPYYIFFDHDAAKIVGSGMQA